jgi:hypothetical protein
MRTLFLDRRAAKALIRMVYVINVVEEPYGMCGEGRGKMPAKTDLFLEHGDFRGITAGLARCGGGKMVNVQSRKTHFVFRLRHRKR